LTCHASADCCTCVNGAELGYEILVIFMIVIVIFAAVGIFVLSFLGVMYVKYVVQKHIHMLYKWNLSKDFIVEDLAASSHEDFSCSIKNNEDEEKYFHKNNDMEVQQMQNLNRNELLCFSPLNQTIDRSLEYNTNFSNINNNNSNINNRNNEVYSSVSQDDSPTGSAINNIGNNNNTNNNIINNSNLTLSQRNFLISNGLL
jgi:hypothetical protein